MHHTSQAHTPEFKPLVKRWFTTTSLSHTRVHPTASSIPTRPLGMLWHMNLLRNQVAFIAQLTHN